jgi:D-sedoheptulose 7-phosphate isomerase
MMKLFFKDLQAIIDTIDREPIGKLLNALEALQWSKGRLFIIGVGGSAANASHAAADFRNLTGIDAYSMDNMAEVTARTNDEGFESIFEEWLRVSSLDESDMVLVFSVGGGDKDKNVSVNLIRALDYAKKVGAVTAGIVGRDGGYTKQVADICVLIPTVNEGLVTPFVESFQAFIWHFFVFHTQLNIKEGKWEGIWQKER